MKVVQNTKSLIQQKSQARMWTYGIVAVLSIAALFYIIPPVHNDNSNAMTGTSMASDTTLSISLSGGVLPLDITPTSSAGTFASTVSGDTHATVRVATNNITGYTIGIKASNPNSSTADKLISDNEQCENTPTSAKCAINSLPQPVTEAQYIDNTGEGVDLNNTWGYLPSKYN